MTPVDKALLVSAEQILRINGYEAEAGAVGRVGENLESAERDAGRWRPQLVDGLDCGGAHQGADEMLRDSGTASAGLPGYAGYNNGEQ